MVIIGLSSISAENERWDDHRADLNFEVDFGANGAIGTIVTE